MEHLEPGSVKVGGNLILEPKIDKTVEGDLIVTGNLTVHGNANIGESLTVHNDLVVGSRFMNQLGQMMNDLPWLKRKALEYVLKGRI